MIPTLRVFESESAASDAAKALGEANFNKRRVLPEPAKKPKAAKSKAKAEGEETPAEEPAAAAPPADIERELHEAYDAGLLARHQVPYCRKQIEAGRYVVAVAASFGFTYEAIEIMEKHGAIADEVPPRRNKDDPSPLSDALGLPVLTDAKPATSLASSHWFFSSTFGMKLLSDKAAPLSSAVGMKTVIDRKGPRNTKLSDKAAPLSSAVGMKTVIDRKGPRGTKLLDNPAPLSSALSIPTLTKKQ
jgi:hypothetical protein